MNGMFNNQMGGNPWLSQGQGTRPQMTPEMIQRLMQMFAQRGQMPMQGGGQMPMQGGMQGGMQRPPMMQPPMAGQMPAQAGMNLQQLPPELLARLQQLIQQRMAQGGMQGGGMMGMGQMPMQRPMMSQGMGRGGFPPFQR